MERPLSEWRSGLLVVQTFDHLRCLISVQDDDDYDYDHDDGDDLALMTP